MQRKQTNVVQIGSTFIGGNEKIAIQSMTNTKTKDVASTLKQIEDLKKYAVISISDLEIKKVFNANQLNEFNEYIISMYEDFYKNKLTTSKTLFFDFAYDNPFNTQGVGSYKYGGYIRDAGSLYMIYLQPTPYKIDK